MRSKVCYLRSIKASINVKIEAIQSKLKLRVVIQILVKMKIFIAHNKINSQYRIRYIHVYFKVKMKKKN